MDQFRVARTAFVTVAITTTAALSTGFISTRAGSGAAVSWGNNNTLTFRTNAINTSGMSESDIFSVFTVSIGRWKAAARDGFLFNYYQGSDSGTYPNYTGSTRDNSVFFTSNARSGSDQLPCGTVAVTQVWFNNSSGGAFKADLRFNDQCFTFTMRPTDTASQRNIYLPDVATHELGHAMGLDHSQNLQSSMVYTAAIQQSYPSCDDHAAMMSLYASGADQARTARIQGRVLSPSGGAIFGAFVEAISLQRGKAVASGMTDTDGSYNISGLEAGTYSILISPYYPGSSSLGRYYGAINSAVCSGGALFARSVAKESNGLLKTVSVSQNSSAVMGDTLVSCTALSSSFSGSERGFASAPTIVNGGEPQAGVASSFSGSSDHYYRLVGVTGALLVHAAAQSLYSRSDVTVELLDTAGRRLSGSNSYDNVFSSVSGFVNYDSQAGGSTGTTATDIIVHVSQRATLSNSAFPSGSTAVDAVPFYLLTVSRGVNSSTAIYEMNARCQAPDNFASYASQGDPGRMPDSSGGGSSQKQSGGCGLIKDVSGDEGPFKGTGAQARMVNFALILALILPIRRWGVLTRGNRKRNRAFTA